MIARRRAPHYRSYLLRFWQERGGSGDTAELWRFSLEDPHTGTRHGFATLDELVAALRREMDDTKEADMTQEGQADEAAIRGLVNQVEGGWNEHDGNAFAAPFAEDADYVVVDGFFVKGREAIARGHQQIFDTIYKESRNSATVVSVRFLTDDIALGHIEWRLTFRHDGIEREGRAFSTMVFNRRDGLWQIAAFQNTPIAPRGAGGPVLPPAPAAPAIVGDTTARRS